jgi:hypothetical protein
LPQPTPRAMQPALSAVSKQWQLMNSNATASSLLLWLQHCS